MDIQFRTRSLQKKCNSLKEAQKAWGTDCGKRVMRRLDDLRAADTLEIMRFLPGRCHELTENRKGQLAIDVRHPYRLVFEVVNNPIPLKRDGGLDWTRTTAIRILEVEDYHG